MSRISRNSPLASRRDDSLDDFILTQNYSEQAAEHLEMVFS